MKKFTTVAMAALAMASLACAGKATAQVKSSFVIGSTASTSGHYVAAVAMSKALKDEIPNLSVTVLETGASVDNLRRMTRAEIDMGLVGSDAAVSASDGTGQFEGKGIGDLVALFAYDYAALSIAVRADSGVLTLADLNGKRFNPGFRGSGTEVRMKTAFDLFNIKPEWVLGSIKDAVESIQNRQIVGYAKNGVGSLLDPTVRELLISTQMRLLGFSPEQEALHLQKVKGVTFATLPENIFPGQQAVRVPAIFSIYMTRLANTNDDTAYAVTKAIYDKRSYLFEVFPHLKDVFDLRAESLRLEEMGLTLHPGAKKFWQSVPASGVRSS
ncbi:MAG: TAXI family TRAP transporter solute-binding subunit [Alphaproteobacteria bacterium]